MKTLLTEQILLCIPRGGLNDTLCQIEMCRRYADAHDRRLYVDARKSGLLGNADIFFRMSATGRWPPVLHMNDTTVAAINAMELHPAIVQGRVGQYNSLYSKGCRNICEEPSGTRLTFNLSAHNDAQVLLHEQCGGGTLSHDLLPHLTLSKDVRSNVLDKLSMLPEGYVACHVRNTDYQTDYLHFFASIEVQVADRPVLICSDDARVIHDARKVFQRSKVLALSEASDLVGKPLHRPENYKSDGERVLATTTALTDLFALASATELHTTTIRGGGVSGFSALAKHLHTNKHIMASMLQLHSTPSESENHE